MLPAVEKSQKQSCSSSAHPAKESWKITALAAPDGLYLNTVYKKNCRSAYLEEVMLGRQPEPSHRGVFTCIKERDSGLKKGRSSSGCMSKSRAI